MVGTWNTLTMLKPGKMRETAEQIQNTTLPIVALQEIWWKEYGHIKKKKKVIHSTIAATQTQQDTLAQVF